MADTKTEFSTSTIKFNEKPRQFAKTGHITHRSRMKRFSHQEPTTRNFSK